MLELVLVSLLLPGQPAAPVYLPASAPPHPSTSAPPPGQVVTFDPYLVQVVWSREGWRLMVGPDVLKDFGDRQEEARHALRVIRDLRLTQRVTIGSPIPVMEYWLASGRAPEGRAHGTRVFPLDLDTLQADQREGQWCVRDKARIFFNFGLRSEDARAAEGAIRGYQFTRIALIGQASPSMMIFLHDRNDLRRTQLGGLRARAEASSSFGDSRRPQPRAGTAPTAASWYMTPALPPLRPVRSPVGSSGEIQQVSGAYRERAVPGLSDLTTRVPFDWRQVHVHRQDETWQLRSGQYVLAQLGKEEREARQALGVIQYYRFTEQCLVGHPAPQFSYYLIAGKAPRGMMFGVRSQAFESDQLAVKKEGESWNLQAGDSVLLRLGSRPDEAIQLLEAIRRHRFDRLCWLGDPASPGAFTFFVQSR